MIAKYWYLSPRKSWVGLVILFTFGLFFPEGASAQAKTERVAILKSADIAPYNQAIEAFRSNLPIKHSLVHEYNLMGELENGPDIAQNIFDSKVDLVLAVGLKASLVAKIEIREIPVIFCMVLNPKKFELEAPNLKGISLAIPFKEQFFLLQKIIPTLSRIGVLYDPEKSGHLVKKSRGEAQDLGIELIAQGVSSQKDCQKRSDNYSRGFMRYSFFQIAPSLQKILSISPQEDFGKTPSCHGVLIWFSQKRCPDWNIHQL